MKILPPVLGLLCVILAGISWQLWQKNRVAAAALADAMRDRVMLQGRITQLEKNPRGRPDEPSSTRRPDGARPERPPGGDNMRVGGGGGPGGPGGPGFGGPAMQMLESPEMRQLMAIQQKGRLDSRYAALFKSLGLPPEKLDKFKQLLVDKQSAAMDVMAEARAQGLVGPDSRAQIQDLLKSTNQELDDSIRSTLGDAGYEQYQQYDRTQSQRALVDQLASRLSYTDSPLTAQQAQQLVPLLAGNAPATSGSDGAANVHLTATVSGPGGNASMIIGDSSGATLTNESVAAAQDILTPSQVDALRQLQAEQLAQQQMGQNLRQSFPPGAPAG